MAAKFELKQTEAGQLVFNLRSANGKVILTSERYASRAAALNGIKSVRRNAGADARFERRTSEAGQPFFVLRAANKEVIGRSEMYTRAANMEKGIAAVKAAAGDAALDDQTQS
jgi:uncharacterized protein YegP (UPF0339 family)